MTVLPSTPIGEDSTLTTERQMSAFQFVVNEKRTAVTIVTNNPVSMDAAALETFIETLMNVRMDLQPARPNLDPFFGTRVITHLEMRWYVAPVVENVSDVLVCMMHPGLGWIGMHLDRGAASEFVGAIIRNFPNRGPEPASEGGK